MCQIFWVSISCFLLFCHTVMQRVQLMNTCRHINIWLSLGKPVFSNIDEFPENFRTASDPRPFFGKKYCDFFPNRTKPHQICNENFQIGNDPPPFLTFFRKIMTKIGVFKAKKNAMKFFGSEMTPPPLSEIFRKFIDFCKYRLPLERQALDSCSSSLSMQSVFAKWLEVLLSGELLSGDCDQVLDRQTCSSSLSVESVFMSPLDPLLFQSSGLIYSSSYFSR